MVHQPQEEEESRKKRMNRMNKTRFGGNNHSIGILLFAGSIPSRSHKPRALLDGTLPEITKVKI